MKRERWLVRVMHPIEQPEWLLYAGAGVIAVSAVALVWSFWPQALAKFVFFAGAVVAIFGVFLSIVDVVRHMERTERRERPRATTTTLPFD